MWLQPGEILGWECTEWLSVVLGWSSARAPLLSGAECFCTINSVLQREVGMLGWPMVFICVEALALLIYAAGEVLRLGVQPSAMPCAADR